MPIYEYKCLDCNHKFDRLLMCVSNSVSVGQTDSIDCPECKQTNIERVMSVIAKTPNKWKV